MIKDIDGLLKQVTKELKNFTDIATIGLSGGADSTLVALLCCRALGPENVYGISMPYTIDDDLVHNSNSVKFAKHIKINSIVHHIQYGTDGLFKNILNNLNQGHIASNLAIDIDKKWKLVYGNARARERMQVLYTYNEFFGNWTGKRCRVIGTGNLSEDFIGYATKYGDLGVDINPIGDLFKSEVYQLLDWFIRQGTIEETHVQRTPSANLWEDQTDEEEIGMSYDEMEPVIHDLLQPHGLGLPVDEKIYDKVQKLYFANLHKMEPVPSIPLFDFCNRKVLR